MSEASRSGASACRKRRAVTLIEAVLFIAIALGLIVGGLVFFQQASTAQRTQQTMRLNQALTAEARTLMRRSPPDSLTDITTVLVQSGAVPSNAINAETGGIRTPDGDAISAYAGPIDEIFDYRRFPAISARDNALLLEMSIPSKVCARIAAFDPEDGTGPAGNGIWVVGIQRDIYRSNLAPDLDRSESGIGLSPGETGRACRSDSGITRVSFIFGWSSG
jgi:type II secretory pathway pseudopilin PulG